MLRLTADGCQDSFALEQSDCCAPPLCGNDLCCTFVAFMNLLPSGPLWDFWKNAAISYFESHDDPANCPLIRDPACPSIVLHAIYAVLRLRGYVHNALWPALRESNPYTAVTTLDAHLAKLQWEDCYLQHCRSVLLGDITPYEVITDCGPVFCPGTFPDDLACAVKRNIAIALTRANMGIIKNICSINWVIQPLGAEIKPRMPYAADPPPPVDTAAKCYSPCSNRSAPVEFDICNTRDWLEGCNNGDVCDTLRPLPKIQAYWDRGCDKPAGLPDRIWPGVLAAECIVRSMMPTSCPSNIHRCC
jgi:hypothetical protein